MGVSGTVVYLVGALGVEVLPLEQERAAQLRREPLRRVQQRRTSGVAPQEVVELGAEPRIGPRLTEGGIELGAGPDQRLRDVPDAVAAEPPGRAWVSHPGLSRHLSRLRPRPPARPAGSLKARPPPAPSAPRRERKTVALG